MGDDAEYFIEQMQEEQLLSSYAMDHPSNNGEFCFLNEENEDEHLFDWSPKGRICWLSKLHSHGIGEKSFFARLEDKESSMMRGTYDKSKFIVVENSFESDFEVLVVIKENIENLKNKAGQIGNDNYEKYVDRKSVV